MRIIVFLLIIVGFLAYNKTVNAKNLDEITEFELDTLKDNAIYYLDTISKEEFLALPKNEKIYIDCSEEEVINDVNVVRKDSVLSFHLQNGAIKNLANGKESYDKYCYKTSLDEINQWVVCALCGDEHSYSLFIDKSNGQEISAVSYPILSPNRKYFVCVKMNWTGYHVIQLFKVEKDKQITRVWYKLLTNWGTKDVRWKDDKTLLVRKEAMKIVEGESYFNDTSYVVFPLEKYLK